MDVLIPIPDMDAKLDSDMQKQVENAEKTARSLVSSATKKQQVAEAKEIKQRKKAKKGAAATEDDALMAIEREVQQAERAVQRAADDEKQNAEVMVAIKKAVDAIKKPKSVPLTAMAANKDQLPTDAAARTKILQDILEAKKKEAELMETDHDQKPVSESLDATKLFGMQGVLAELRRTGTVAVKAKKVKDDRHCVNDVLKMGKHLLK